MMTMSVEIKVTAHGQNQHFVILMKCHTLIL